MFGYSAGDILFIAAVCALIFGILFLVKRSGAPRPEKVPSSPEAVITDQVLTRILVGSRSVAVVGASSDPGRPSHQVFRYLKDAGYCVIPVNPKEETILGETSYRSVAELPEAPDIVDVFRNPEHVPEIAREAVARGAKVLWLQEGVISTEGMEIAREGGLLVVMDHCIAKEHRRLLGRP